MVFSLFSACWGSRSRTSSPGEVDIQRSGAEVPESLSQIVAVAPNAARNPGSSASKPSISLLDKVIAAVRAPFARYAARRDLMAARRDLMTAIASGNRQSMEAVKVTEKVLSGLSISEGISLVRHGKFLLESAMQRNDGVAVSALVNCASTSMAQLSDKSRFLGLWEGEPSLLRSATEAGHAAAVAAFVTAVAQSTFWSRDKNLVRLLEAKVGNSRDTGLESAMQAGHADVVTAYLEPILESKLPDETKCRLLSTAATGYSSTALFLAMREHRTEAVAAFVKRVIDSDLPADRKREVLEGRDGNGRSVLCAAMAANDAAAVTAFVGLVIDSSVADDEKCQLLRAQHGRDSALHEAMEAGHAASVEAFVTAIIRSGLPEDRKYQLLEAHDSQGRSALAHAMNERFPAPAGMRATWAGVMAFVAAIADSGLPEDRKRQLLQTGPGSKNAFWIAKPVVQSRLTHPQKLALLHAAPADSPGTRSLLESAMLDPSHGHEILEWFVTSDLPDQQKYELLRANDFHIVRQSFTRAHAPPSALLRWVIASSLRDEQKYDLLRAQGNTGDSPLSLAMKTGPAPVNAFVTAVIQSGLAEDRKRQLLQTAYDSRNASWFAEPVIQSRLTDSQKLGLLRTGDASSRPTSSLLYLALRDRWRHHATLEWLVASDLSDQQKHELLGADDFYVVRQSFAHFTSPSLVRWVLESSLSEPQKYRLLSSGGAAANSGLGWALSQGQLGVAEAAAELLRDDLERRLWPDPAAMPDARKLELLGLLFQLHQRFPDRPIAGWVTQLLQAVNVGDIKDDRELLHWASCVPLATPEAQFGLFRSLHERCERSRSRMDFDLMNRLDSAAQAQAIRLFSQGKRRDLLLDFDFSHADCAGMNFAGWNFGRGASSSRNRFYASSSSGKQFYGANLRGADFHGADLYGVRFEQATLAGATLAGATLDGADFGCADLSNADLRGVVFEASPWTNASLRSANLSGANLRDTDLTNFVAYDTNFTGADLRGATAPGALWSSRCLLTNAKLDLGFVEQLDKQLAQDSLNSAMTDPERSDRLFNHLANDGRSVLAMIDSIPVPEGPDALKVKELKVGMLERIVNAAARTMPGRGVASSMMDVLCRDPLYCSSPAIQQFIRSRLDADLHDCQTQRLLVEPPSEGWLRLMMDHVAAALGVANAVVPPLASAAGMEAGSQQHAQEGAVPAAVRPKGWVLDNGFGMFQLYGLAYARAEAFEKASENSTSQQVALGQRQEADRLRSQALAIRNAYVAVAGKTEERPSTDVSSLVRYAEDAIFAEECFPVFSSDGSHAFVMTNTYLEQCGRAEGAAPKPWGQGCRLVRDWNPPQQDSTRKPMRQEGQWTLTDLASLNSNVKDVLKAVAPPLAARYASENQAQTLRRCLERLLPQPYADLALREREYSRHSSAVSKWIVTDGSDEQMKVQNALSAHVMTATMGNPWQLASAESGARPVRVPSSDYLPGDALYEEMMADNAELVRTEGNPDRVKEAYFCRCWAAVLAALSSSAHFGTETDSPESVRNLALAFLNKAGQLATASGIENDIEAKQKLIGEQFSCTDAVFSSLKTRLKAEAEENAVLQDIYNALIPSLW